MGLNDFVVNDGRALPVFILADTSGSMAGEKIQVLNNALRDMVASLSGIEEVRGVFQICIITFGEAARIHQPLANVGNIVLDEMTAKGKTPMGEAFRLVAELVEDRNIVSSRAYSPTIVLVSDGQPTDFTGDLNATVERYLQWEALKLLHAPKGRVSRCLRLAMGIGRDADTNMLKAFVNNLAIPVIQSKDSAGITDFFRWVTMSTVSRINSKDPNDPMSLLPLSFEKDEIVL